MGDERRDGRATLEAIFTVTRDRRLSAGELRLWLLYRSYEGREHGGFPGDALLAEHMDRSPRSVQGYRASLLEKGYLEQTLRGPKPAHYRAVLPDDAPNPERPQDGSAGEPEVGPLPTASEVVERGYPEAFETCWSIYPTRSGGNPKKGAYRAWRARVDNGTQPEELEAGTKRYRDYCERESMTGTRYVKQAKTFFGPDEWFREEWSASSSSDAAPYAGGRLQ